jgi:MYXO-CTERM domain-containing protein
MNHLARRSGIPLSRLAFAVLALALVCRTAAAQVIEPNGTSVPGPTTDPISLQQYFTSVNENINAVANASITPATFTPLCNFQATLVLSQSSATGGLGWYNVPDATTDPNHTQTPTVYPIGTFPMVVGAVVGSSDIRSNAAYAGGLVGFALMKAVGTNGAVIPVYYSEDTRNADCTGCSMPGYWKMMLSYESTVASNEYYMAWEDWEGANTTTWFGNDGDFNDKVFAISGVTCDGGGVPCQTTMQGVCANGITQCVVGGTPTCVPTIKPSPEKCDNLDNDCNGMVDDGDGLCPTGQVCVQGKCTGPCSDTEFPCGPPLVCMNGLCVDPSCVGVTCKAGQLCQSGTCVGGCDGVVCPTNQICELGVCVDPCQGVTCNGSVCVLGVCVQNCSCQACPKGQVCSATGACVDDGCDTMTCGAGEVCSNGTCGDACAGAKCPGGAACSNGQCDPPLPPGSTGSGGTTGSGGIVGTTGTGGIVGTTGAGGSSTGKGGAGGTVIGTGGSTAVSGSGGTGSHEEGGVVSCSCDSARTGGGGPVGRPILGLMLLALAFVTTLRRRRARR